MAPCFVNGIEVYDGEINLGEEDNMISKEYAVKLCLEHEVKRGNKVAKKELIVALKGKIYFVKFIINLDEDDVEPETEDEGKDMYDWDQLLDFNLDDIELLGEEELPPFVCKMGKSSRNKKKSMENLSLFYQDIGTLQQPDRVRWKKCERRRGSSKMDKSGKHKRGRYLGCNQNIPLYCDGTKVNENALADTGSDINTMPYRIYEQLGREEMKKVDRGITMINHTQAEVMGILTNKAVSFFGSLPVPLKHVNWKPDYKGSYTKEEEATGYDHEAGSSRTKRSRQHEKVEEAMLPRVHHKFLLWEGCSRDVKSRCDGEIDEMLRIRVREVRSDEEIFISVAWIRAFNIN
ncbi:hypothetical protein Tco_0739276 [Tanacetum coccineum]